MTEYEAVAFMKFEIDCECGNVFESDHDPSGELLTCDDCGMAVRVVETR